MQFGILLLLTALPILELALLIKLGQMIGFWWTLALIFGTGLAGVAIIQMQGLAMLSRFRDMIDGRTTTAGFDFGSGLLMMAGTLLVLPGPLSDVVGLLLLLPPVRSLVARWVARRVTIYTETIRTTSQPSAEPPSSGGTNAGPIIDGEFERLDERSIHPDGRGSPGRKGPQG